MFKVKRPCSNCPFLKAGGIRLTQGRVKEIASYFTDEGAGAFFPCHKTAGDTEDDEGEPRPVATGEVCAGGMLFALKQNRMNQVMQLGERLTKVHPDLGCRLDKLEGRDLVFDSLRQMLKVNRDEF